MFKAKPIDLTKWLGKARNLVMRVGIELEGGWTLLRDDVALTQDWSVVFDRDANAYRKAHGRWPASYIGPQHVGELPSAPMEVSEFPAWIKKYYPSHVNETCGMHYHVSFRDALVYQRLMVEEFPATMVKEMMRWGMEQIKQHNLEVNHPLFARCKGDSEYCQHIFAADMQARVHHKAYDHHALGHRYTVINYPLVQRTTIENRLLPMMPTAELAIEAMTHALAVTNAFIFAMKGREPREDIEVELPPGGGLREEIRDYI